MPPIRTRDKIELDEIQSSSEPSDTTRFRLEQEEERDGIPDSFNTALVQYGKGRRSESLYDDDDMPPLVDAPASDPSKSLYYSEGDEDFDEHQHSRLPPPTFMSMQHTFFTDMTPYSPQVQFVEPLDASSTRKGTRSKGNKRRSGADDTTQFQTYVYPQEMSPKTFSGTASIRASPPPDNGYLLPPVFRRGAPAELRNPSGLYPDDSTNLPAVPAFPAFAPPDYEYQRPSLNNGHGASAPTTLSLQRARTNIKIVQVDPHADSDIDVDVGDEDPEPPEPEPERVKAKRASHSRKRPASYIPRAPNAFILFRAAFIKSERVPARVEGKNQTLSQIIGMLWKTLPASERAEWEAKAVVAQAEHRRQYPDWRFKPDANATANGDTFRGYDPGKKQSKTNGKFKGKVKDGGRNNHNASPGPGPSTLARRLDPVDAIASGFKQRDHSSDIVASEKDAKNVLPFSFPTTKPPTNSTADSASASDRATLKKKKYATARVAQIAQLLVAGKEGQELEVAVDEWEASRRQKKEGKERLKREQQLVEAKQQEPENVNDAAKKPVVDIASSPVQPPSGYDLRSRSRAKPALAIVPASVPDNNQSGERNRGIDSGVTETTKNKEKGRHPQTTEDVDMPRRSLLTGETSPDPGTALIDELTGIRIDSVPRSPGACRVDTPDVVVSTKESGFTEITSEKPQATAPKTHMVKRSLSAPASDSRTAYAHNEDVMEIDVVLSERERKENETESVYGYSIPAPGEGGVASPAEDQTSLSVPTDVNDSQGYAVPAPSFIGGVAAALDHRGQRRGNTFPETSAKGPSSPNFGTRRETVHFPMKPSDYARAVSSSPSRSHHRRPHLDNDVRSYQSQRQQTSSGVHRGRTFTPGHSRSSSFPHHLALRHLPRDTEKGFDRHSPYSPSEMWNFNEGDDAGNDTVTNFPMQRTRSEGLYNMYGYNQEALDEQQRSPISMADTFPYESQFTQYTRSPAASASPSLPPRSTFENSFPATMSDGSTRMHYSGSATDPPSPFSVSPFSTLTGWAGDEPPWPTSASVIDWEPTNNDWASSSNVLPNPHMISANNMHDPYSSDFSNTLPNPRGLAEGIMHDNNNASFSTNQHQYRSRDDANNFGRRLGADDDDNDEPIVTSRVSKSGLGLSVTVSNYNDSEPQW